MKRHLMTALLGLLFCASPARALTTEALLDSTQYSAFRFFWYEGNPTTGLIRDRNQLGSPCSIASLGFGLSSICVAIDHGWITRDEGKARVLAALQTLWNAPQGTATFGTAGYKGLYYHFLDMNSATRVWSSELSTIDTALLFAGILDCKQYFTLSDPTENLIRTLADSIYGRADWAFMQNGGPGIKMGWKPENGFIDFGEWTGYNEAMILYILAIGSPTHPVPGSAWSTWTSNYQWRVNLYGQTYLIFPPLFGHQYSHCWIDFRGVQDAYMQSKGITYFENSRRATYAQRSWCIANPLSFTGYSDSLWGITAGDGPTGYRARGAPPYSAGSPDDGTISPTAPASSIAFAPEICIPAIRNIYNAYHSQTWGSYGFSDAFNLTQNWWDIDNIGIDSGPIVLMIENYLRGSIWNRFMQNADVLRGLQLAGFVNLVGVEAGLPPGPRVDRLFPSEPNPVRGAAVLRFQLASAGHVRLTIYDLQGREVARLVDGERPAGIQTATFEGRSLPRGVYHARLESNGRRQVTRFVRLD
jgi:hypothetical protein